MASQVAFRFQKPFSFVIPAKYDNISTVHDNTLAMDDFDHIILLTDAISTWETIKSVMDKYQIPDEKLTAIYTVLYRKPQSNDLPTASALFHRRTFSLNNNFPIEIVNKSLCRYQNNCLAKNLKVH